MLRPCANPTKIVAISSQEFRVTQKLFRHGACTASDGTGVEMACVSRASRDGY